MTRWTQEQYDDFVRAKDSTPPKYPGVPSRPAPKITIQPSLGKSETPRTKYGNRKHIDGEGIEHDSRKEYLRWCELKRREQLGLISDLHRQVVFDLIVAGVLVARFIADATYQENGALVVEDTKSPITRAKPDFRIKLKLMKAIHNIDVRVVE